MTVPGNDQIRDHAFFYFGGHPLACPRLRISSYAYPGTRPGSLGRPRYPGSRYPGTYPGRNSYPGTQVLTTISRFALLASKRQRLHSNLIPSSSTSKQFKAS
eukprot:2121042-Rhodomonas_salina.1